MRILSVLLILSVLSGLARGQEEVIPHPPRTLSDKPAPAGIPADSPAPEADERVLPINLATALRLAGSRPIDVELAGERIRRAAAQLSQAKALWLPSVTLGGDYNRHDGPIQDASGTVVKAGRSSTMFGLGSGIGNAAILSFNEAVFGPLAARQTLQARQADLRAAANDAMVAVTDAYFNVEQARGELAGALASTVQTEELLHRVENLAPGLIPPLEVTRVQAELARRKAAELLARERWQVASAELVRLLRLDPTSQVAPLEPPHLQVTLVDPRQPVDDLVILGLRNRPELASNRAQVENTLVLLRQEKLRPLMPSLLMRGWSTPVTGTLGFGAFAGGTNGSQGGYGLREDIDVQLLWQLDNLGFGNRARIRGRESEYRLATIELLRLQDRIAAEVARAYAQAQRSGQRVEFAEREVVLSVDSYEKNLVGLGQTRRINELVQTVVRSQEVLAAVQSLAQAYINFYGAVADSNRAQFRLYYAIGRPAQLLGSEIAPCGEPACPPAPTPLPSEHRNPTHSPETLPSR